MAFQFETIMNETELSRLSERYLAALRIHLKQNSTLGPESARDMGRQSLAIGLETLDMAKIHEIALAALILPDCSSSTRDGMCARAAVFFTEAITPIEETHRAALQSNIEVQRAREKLDQRTRDVMDSNRELEQQVTERKMAHAALQTNNEASGQLLKESSLLEKDLQEMARKILSANEEERTNMSRQLQGEIAQTLLGIHVRLLALKKVVAANTADLDREIAFTERVVEDSVTTLNRLTHEFGIQYES